MSKVDSEGQGDRFSQHLRLAPAGVESKVEFACIGAGKAGTTWLWKALSSHPDIFLPKQKEIHYFNKETFEDPRIQNPNFGKPLSWYHRHFVGARAGQLRGDFSPSYLWSETAPRLMKEYSASWKILAILREPVDRTYSHYLFARQRGLFSNLSFEDACRRFPFFVDQSEYGRLLRPYYELFPRDQLRILFFEDLKSDPRRVLEAVHAFLNIRVGEGEIPEATNETGVPTYPRLNRLLTMMRVGAKRHHAGYLLDLGHAIGLGAIARRIRHEVAPFRGRRPEMPARMRMALQRRFAPDLRVLEEVIGERVDRWRESWLGNE